MNNPSKAWKFVLLVGGLSLLADLTYEGGRSITGPFLTALGASPLVISAISGGGELIGYSLRYFSGRWTDKSRKYWPIAFAGYCLNLLSIPALAFCGSIAPAAALLIGERAGKGIRNPPRDAMLSYAAEETGKAGTAFGIHDAMDKTGAVFGPLLIAALFFKTRNFSMAFGSLFFSALAGLGLLMFAAARYSNPAKTTPADKRGVKPLDRSHSAFWRAVIAASFLAAGTADFPFIARHFEKAAGIANTVIPLLYALAMAAGAVFSFILSRLFDRIGIRILVITAFLGIAAVLIIFQGHNLPAAAIGSFLWGAGFAAQEPVVKAHISRVVHADERATAYGIFWAFFGISWFAGSLGIGLLYQYSIRWMIGFSVALQCLALPFILSLEIG